jgi:hypothetical protein
MGEVAALLGEPALHTASLVLLAGTFVIALQGKLRDFDGFVGTVANYRLLPGTWAGPAAFLTVSGEIAAVSLLLPPATRPAGAALAALLLAVFTVAIGINLARGRFTIDCGCFRGFLRERLTGWHVVRNLVLLAGAMLLLTEPLAEGSILDHAVGFVAAATLLLLFLAGAHLAFDPRHELVAEPHERVLGGSSA